MQFEHLLLVCAISTPTILFSTLSLKNLDVILTKLILLRQFKIYAKYGILSYCPNRFTDCIFFLALPTALRFVRLN